MAIEYERVREQVTALVDGKLSWKSVEAELTIPDLALNEFPRTVLLDYRTELETAGVDSSDCRNLRVQWLLAHTGSWHCSQEQITYSKLEDVEIDQEAMSNFTTISAVLDWVEQGDQSHLIKGAVFALRAMGGSRIDYWLAVMKRAFLSPPATKRRLLAILWWDEHLD